MNVYWVFFSNVASRTTASGRSAYRSGKTAAAVKIVNAGVEETSVKDLLL